MVNLHYLELFYFLARHGGVSEAARKMPYGISRQMCQFEEQIGVCLYRRRPFELTAAGERLFAFIKPILEDLPWLVGQLRTGVPDAVRLGASPVVLREYLPSILRSLRGRFPQLRLAFCEGPQWQIEEWLKARTVDLAVTTLEGEPPADCLAEPLLLLVEPAKQQHQERAKPMSSKASKARRTTHRSRTGRKLYAVRVRGGKFKDIQTYERAQRADLAHKSKSERLRRPADL